jgi:predicted GH43/DUF377 family glycosyl hydrolase
MFRIVRCPENPIVVPGIYDWRRAVVFNPGAIHAHGRFYLFERAAGGLRPFHCCIGALVSDDGVNFQHLSPEPVFTPEMAGSRHGSVQDPRVVALDGRYVMTYAFRPFAWNSSPTGVGVPESSQASYPGFSGAPESNQTRSGLAVSDDLVSWRHHGWVTPPELDDRDVVLFPERIGGRYAALRRPLQLVGPEWGTDKPSIWISFSSDLVSWSAPELVAVPHETWENDRIGAAAPPIRTEAGWLLLHHGVQNEDGTDRRVVYRTGALLLDLADPRRVIARTRTPILEPEAYYERFGLYIPNVVFPTGAVVVNDTVWIYYGVCDTAIALGTVPLDDLVERVLSGC